MWEDIALAFEDRWNFPNCIGALDGKHIYITALPKSGSLFYNYKGSFSIVLLALVDGNYKFIAIQVGDFGKSSDGGVYSNSTLGRAMKEKTLSVPEEKCLPGTEDLGRLPYVMVGDAAFPLKPYLMRPYPGKNIERRKANFNYRLSRHSTKAFDILSSRWRIYHRDINLMPETTDTMIVVTCILHNMQTQPGEAEHWLREASEVVSLRGLTERPNRGSLEASIVREKFADYFSSQAACFCTIINMGNIRISKSSKGGRAFSHLAPKLWNGLPDTHSHNAYLLVLCYAIRNRLPLKLLNAPVGLDSLLDKRVGAYGWVAESSGYGEFVQFCVQPLTGISDAPTPVMRRLNACDETTQRLRYVMAPFDS
ncbi:hypothetical protein F2P79_003242 [Pimephales promelas]|nr:hypothetical protein F2P79_003242 [Pimephales promelas]